MIRSAKALDVPDTVLMAASISRASCSMTLRSCPMTLTPTGVRMPVASMSMRASMGMVQAFETPGIAAPGDRLDQLVDGHAGTPLGFRLQVDDRLEHLGRRRVGRGRGAAGLAENGCPPRGRS